MILHTASEGITFAKKLENESAEFYETLAKRYTKDAETLLVFAKDNKKNMVQIERTYYGVITDAIEGSYAFNINPDDYDLDILITQGASYTDVLAQAVKIEEKIIKFYLDAAEQSQSLMADIPRAFTLVAKKRGGRIQMLKSLLQKEGAELI
jgi:rubrerythrin